MIIHATRVGNVVNGQDCGSEAGVLAAMTAIDIEHSNGNGTAGINALGAYGMTIRLTPSGAILVHLSFTSLAQGGMRIGWIAEFADMSAARTWAARQIREEMRQRERTDLEQIRQAVTDSVVMLRNGAAPDGITLVNPPTGTLND